MDSRHRVVWITPGKQALEESFSSWEVKLYKPLILLLFSFSKVNFMPVESATLAAQENGGLCLPMRKVREKEQPCSQRSICPVWSRGLRRKWSKNQILSCLCWSLTWKLGQLPCSASVFLSADCAGSLENKSVLRFKSLLLTRTQTW